METITSLQNAKVKKWVRLHKKKERDAAGLFLVEGEHLVTEAIRAGVLEYVITDEKDGNWEKAVLVTPEIMRKISANVSAVHLIGVCRQKRRHAEHPERVLLLDGVQDPGNLGTLIRTAVSFSFDAVYCSPDTADVYNEKTVRSTQGALFHIPVIYGSLADTAAWLKEEGFVLVGTALRDACGMKEIRPREKMAFVLGNEGQGVSGEMLAWCDERLFIEMQGFESLNVAVAGGIVMYAFQKDHQ